MLDQDKIDSLNESLERLREIRLDQLPDQGSLIEVIADAMNALQVAFVMLAGAAQEQYQSPQGSVFVSVSNPGDVKKL